LIIYRLDLRIAWLNARRGAFLRRAILLWTGWW